MVLIGGDVPGSGSARSTALARVNYLVNGKDVFSLQRILGHTTLDMVRRYMHLADAHVRLQHRRYSHMDVMQAGLRLNAAAY